MGKLTPMMEQYFEIKNQYKDCLLFFRLGDFYEMFFEDALTASKQLEITLTGRDCGQEERAPMCGVPYHSAEAYIGRLIDKGYKVAICEQVEDPKQAKGIVKREVIRVITPGTILQTGALEDDKNHYLMSIAQGPRGYGVSVVDITTGEFYTTELQMQGYEKLIDEIGKFCPVEILYSEVMDKDDAIIHSIKSRFSSYMNPYPAWNFEYDTSYKRLCQHFSIFSLDGVGLSEYTVGIEAAGALLCYLQETQKISLTHISTIIPYGNTEYMVLDICSRRNLELTESLREKSKKGTLLWVLDKTKTAMGARLLRKWIEQPLVKKDAIERRLEAVQECKDNPLFREEIKELLYGVYDLERLMSKVIYGTVNGRDLIALKCSLKMLPPLKSILQDASSTYLKQICEQIDSLEDIYDLIQKGIEEEPPIGIKEGDIIKEGYHPEVDKLRKAKIQGKQWIANLETEEKEKTGIKNLKIRYNKVFGYYIEITRSNFDAVPDRYIRKQTLANAERYITPELKELEETILGAEEKIVQLEYVLFVELREAIGKEVTRIQSTAQYVAILDVLQSLGEVGERQNYTKPKISEEGTIHIQEGRHPVVEKMMSMEQFIGNDTFLDADENRLAIITGPNMAGKSTYMRQTALIVLMAQIGSFVPAQSAHITVVDRIFTRVGASDDLASGQSTFMVEMAEVANILHNATKHSLLIVDEIGRGTSTFDGLSIAWAVVEYISSIKHIGAKTLFATHYHELTELEGKLEGVKNYCIAVQEQGDEVIFLRKIQRGGADNSYGIQVAKLAGLPPTVIQRAKEILEELDQADIAKHTKKTITERNQEKQDKVKEKKTKSTSNKDQISLAMMPHMEIIERLKHIDVMNMTPLQSMEFLYELHKKSKGI